MIFMRLPVPHLGIISPINDIPHPPPCRRLVPIFSSLLLHRTTITRCLAHNSVLTISTRSLHRPTVACPEALAVASAGQAQLQIFDLALIPIVGIRPLIDHIKLDEHTWRQNLSPRARIVPSISLFISFAFSPVLQNAHGPCAYIHALKDLTQTDFTSRPNLDGEVLPNPIQTNSN
jgi:hypothetical protein